MGTYYKGDCLMIKGLNNKYIVSIMAESDNDR